MITELPPKVETWRRRDPAATIVKSGGRYEGPRYLDSALPVFFTDKGYLPGAIQLLGSQGALQELTLRLLQRLHPSDEAYKRSSPHVDNIAASYNGGNVYSYSGTDEQNHEINRAYHELGHYGKDRFSRSGPLGGRGASPTFNSEGIIIPDTIQGILKSTPVIVLGGGAAGIMAAAGFRSVGFEKTLVIEDKEIGGIWRQKNVRDGTINTPFDLDFNGARINRASQGHTNSESQYLGRERQSGKANYDFIQRIANKYNIQPQKGKVVSVDPGNLDHTVTIDTPGGQVDLHAPIVVNAMGAIQPLPPSNIDRMTTNTPELAGKRWQKQYSKAELEALHGQRIIFIGLGNSTIEELYQLQQHPEIDYRVLSHNSRTAFLHPGEEVNLTGDRTFDSYRRVKSFAKFGSIFRNLDESTDLTGVAGDLDWVRNTYERAFNSGRIIPEISHWDADGATLTATDRGGVEYRIPYNQLHTNIGYGNDPDKMRAMGLTVNDEYKGSVHSDFDGEFQGNPGLLGRNRIIPGYFGIGSILKTDFDPNAQVLGGIQFKLPDLLYTAIVRAVEHHLSGISA